MIIRELNPRDTTAYRRVRLRGLQEWPPAFGMPAEEFEAQDQETIARTLTATSDQRLFGSFDNTDLLGILRLSRYSGSNEKHLAYLAGMYVQPEFRRRGIARQLLHSAIESARTEMRVRRVNLTVVTQQAAAIGLYRSAGFILCGTTPEAFEARGEFFDEHLMTLKLPQAT